MTYLTWIGIALTIRKGKPVFPAAPGGAFDLFLNRMHEWGENGSCFWIGVRRIITGSDILGRLLRGIVQNPVVDEGMADNTKEPYVERE